MKNKAVVIKRIVLTTLTAFLIAFIFYNSSLDADTSTVYSSNVLEIINSFFSTLNINLVLTENFIRKLAHFVEFFVLGTLLYYTVHSYLDDLKKDIFITPTCGLLVAVCDEVIQLFSYGRSSQFSDIVLDFSGVCTAVVVLCIFTRFLNNKKLKDKEVSN